MDKLGKLESGAWAVVGMIAAIDSFTGGGREALTLALLALILMHVSKVD